ncbi:rare lipoprotein A [Sphingopyxis panaciterrae]|uniref:septal ring lytic transglycosylase RlpA family protein n=1 Tax=Sphingopyxis panaciterrae TaxID=363841 RepID=UPI001FB99299|nr:septal ring lytic transglycosylase RlpA family protein [Sphingopyxis panaciterrae]NIJ36916.1 rare lipoprotein A [Sphingopyxis panaciterrae]
MAGAALLLSGCGSFGGKGDSRPVTGAAPVSAADVDGPAKLGAPFTIGGTTYTPADIPDYDDVGYAGWYGDELAGQATASGESFDPSAITAAHKTLPLPSYVEVTALDTGRTILVRVNDRGPMVNDRLIDLSRGAAEQLGITGGGAAAVRVRRTNPPASERAQLRGGGAVPDRIATPDSLLMILRNKLKGVPVPAGASPAGTVKPLPAAPNASSPVAQPAGGDRFIVEGPGAKKPVAKPAAKPVTKPAAPAAKPAQITVGGYVKVATFSNQSRAAATAKSLGGTVVKAGNLWQVRMPFGNDAEAKAALAKAKAKGFGDAVVLRDR